MLLQIGDFAAGCGAGKFSVHRVVSALGVQFGVQNPLQPEAYGTSWNRPSAIHAVSKTVLGPSGSLVGLHMADVGRLMQILDRLVDSGNTVVVIEHNLDVVRRADWVIDLGPGAGHHGGRVLFSGRPSQLIDDPRSVTAEYLRRAVADS